MKLIEDLGYLYPKETSKQTRKFGIYECPKCFEHVKMMTMNAKKASGCFACRDFYKTHGESRTKLHNTWKRLKQKCYNENNSHYKWYGAKGITVCKEWLDSYETFRDWALSNGYEDHLELDKDILCLRKGIEPKIYSPDTCLWVNHQENCNVG